MRTAVRGEKPVFFTCTVVRSHAPNGWTSMLSKVKEDRTERLVRNPRAILEDRNG